MISYSQVHRHAERNGRLLACLGLGVWFLFAASPTPAQRPASSAPSVDSFEAFRSIGDRNVFDPNRFPRITRAPSAESTAPADDLVSFVGTLQSEKGTYAFFDGSRPEYRQVLPVGGQIADHTVRSIDAQSATLEGASGPITLRVTDQLRRPPAGVWKVAAAPALLPDALPLSSSGPERPAAVPTNASDALRRLMEKRQKQLKE
jgi:hypothetical protein